VHCLRQWLASGLFDDEAEQQVVGVAVLEGCAGWEVGFVGEGKGQQLGRDPNPVGVMIHACRDFRGVCVVVEAAAHVQQFGDGDVAAVGHAGYVL
jgi:hypothetical protein